MAASLHFSVETPGGEGWILGDLVLCPAHSTSSEGSAGW